MSTDTTNPWNNPSTLAAPSEIPTNREREARELAKERLEMLQLEMAARMKVEGRVAMLEEAIRFALSRVDRRTSYAKRLYAALNNTQRSVVTPT